MDKINPKNIKKILYTSSSSVYGSINNKIKILDQNNRYIYSSTKLSCEMLLKNFSNKSKIDLDICRVFNLYGQDDNFSVISKIKSIVLKNKNEKITIYNNGQSVRDFIHVKDVSKFIKTPFKKGSDTIDIGSGKGLRIIDLIYSLNISKIKLFSKKSLQMKFQILSQIKKNY